MLVGQLVLQLVVGEAAARSRVGVCWVLGVARSVDLLAQHRIGQAPSQGLKQGPLVLNKQARPWLGCAVKAIC